MPSALPTDDASSKMVDNFGIGPYDSPTNDDGSGEDDEEISSLSLPGVPDMFEYEPYIGYPQSETSQGKHATFSQLLRMHPKLASTILPNDLDAPARGSKNPFDKNIDSLALGPTDVTSNSELPTESDNPAARADYYDTMQMGAAMSNMFADQDQGAYVSNEDESLPSPATNETMMDDFLGALGNSDSGYTVEDQAVPYGHPTPDLQDDSNYPKSNNEFVEKAKSNSGGLITFDDIDQALVEAKSKEASMHRTATDIEFVKDLTSKFIKAHGKKGITRRAVTAFLQEAGHGDRQYIASDIVRCLKHEHNIIIPDVLDTFPVRSAGDMTKLSSLRNFFLDSEVYLLDKNIQASKAMGRCASNIQEIIDLFKQHDGGPAITG